MDQTQFRLLSGSTQLDCFTVGDFELVRDILQSRLLNSLCLTEVPTVTVDDETTVDPLWTQLLADALAVSVTVQQDDGIESESMRNYSYKFKDYANSWLALSMKVPDLVNRFNACESGVTFQRDIAGRIYGRNYPCGRCGSCDECI